MWASVGLLVIFLGLLVAVEWTTRRLTSKKLNSPSATPEKATVLQQMTRSKTAEGLERLEGTFWVEFPAEALTATVHIPFCPAFSGIPKVQAFPAEETDAGLRITSLPKPFGVRIDVKRSGSAIGRFCVAVIAEG